MSRSTWSTQGYWRYRKGLMVDPAVKGRRVKPDQDRETALEELAYSLLEAETGSGPEGGSAKRTDVLRLLAQRLEDAGTPKSDATCLAVDHYERAYKRAQDVYEAAIEGRRGCCRGLA